MALLQIGLSIDVDSDEIKRCLSILCPGVEALTLDEADASKRDPWPPIVFEVIKADAVDFPTMIDFLAFPGSSDAELKIGVALARRFSDALACRTVCDGSGHGVPSGPFWSIIWDGGRSFLADDCDSAYMNGVGGPVRIVREIFIRAETLYDKG